MYAKVVQGTDISVYNFTFFEKANDYTFTGHILTQKHNAKHFLKIVTF